MGADRSERLGRSATGRLDWLRLPVSLLLAGIGWCGAVARGQAGTGARGGTALSEAERGLLQPCCMSLVTKTRTARTVGKGRLCLSLKLQHTDFDERLDAAEEYGDLAGDDLYQRSAATVTAKFGWARYHHIGLGAPLFWNDIRSGEKEIRSNGVGNAYVFEKWNCVPEGDRCPGVAIDAWYHFSTGDSHRKLGSSDASGRITAEVSKTWPRFSLHLNPGYRVRRGPDARELNAAVLFTPTKRFWPAVEYNFASVRDGARSHDVVPCFVWKFFPKACWKLGLVFRVDGDTTYRDRLGLVTKLSYTF